MHDTHLKSSLTQDPVTDRRLGCQFRYFLLGTWGWLRRGFKPLDDGYPDEGGVDALRVSLKLLSVLLVPILAAILLPAPVTRIGRVLWLLLLLLGAGYGAFSIVHTSILFYSVRCEEGRILALERLPMHNPD